jgi:AcrR family transcriptional regulator
MRAKNAAAVVVLRAAIRDMVAEGVRKPIIRDRMKAAGWSEPTINRYYRTALIELDHERQTKKAAAKYEAIAAEIRAGEGHGL